MKQRCFGVPVGDCQRDATTLCGLCDGYYCDRCIGPHYREHRQDLPHPGEHPDTRRGSAKDPALDPPRDEVRELAEEIADRLFTNGTGDVAERLVLTVDRPSRNLGGWCRGAVVVQIESRLRAFLAEREEAAACLCQIYFDIAAEAIGEEEVRQRRDDRIALRAELEKGGEGG